MTNAINNWKEKDFVDQEQEELHKHFQKEHWKLRKNTRATTVSMERDSFLGNNMLIDTLQVAEEKTKHQMSSNMKNVVSSQPKVELILQNIVNKIDILQQEVKDTKNRNNNTNNQYHDLFTLNQNHCWTLGCTVGRHSSKTYNYVGNGHKKEATLKNMIGGSKKNVSG